MQTSPTAAVDLYWIPLGAGGHSVRFNGRVFEAIAAVRQHRERCDLYHAALVVELDGDRYTIEVAPSPDADEASRGVVAMGPVGSRYLGRWRLFRYEVRCWRGGSIPDLVEAVGEPKRVTTDARVARRLLKAVATIPTPVWGRDELKAGEMWNSNSVIAWAIATAGIPTDALQPPPRGRAPGWFSGVQVARRGGAHERGHADALEATAGISGGVDILFALHESVEGDRDEAVGIGWQPGELRAQQARQTHDSLGGQSLVRNERQLPVLKARRAARDVQLDSREILEESTAAGSPIS
jgi:hypothetical protein